MKTVHFTPSPGQHNCVTGHGGLKSVNANYSQLLVRMATVATAVECEHQLAYLNVL